MNEQKKIHNVGHSDAKAYSHERFVVVIVSNTIHQVVSHHTMCFFYGVKMCLQWQVIVVVPAAAATM